jgi:DNA-directed RNA polymerase specialized sigma subunit
MDDTHSYSERELIRLAQSSSVFSKAAKEELIQRYSPLIFKIIRSGIVFGTPHEDLLQAGYVGLLEAVQRFNVAVPNRRGALALTPSCTLKAK